MKTIYITGNEQFVIDDILKVLPKFKESLSNVGAKLISSDAKQECSFSQPDYILSDLLSAGVTKELLELCPATNILMISSDMNRGDALVNTLQNDGYYRVNVIDANETTPESLCQMVVTFKKENVKNDDNSVASMFENQEFLTMDKLANENFKVLNYTEKTSEFDDANSESSDDQMKNNDVYLKVRNDARNTAFNLNINNLRSKTIALYSKKGGTGKTTLVKELANVYSSIKLPKKLQNGNEYLTTCTVDFDFDRGNLRTYYGIENPVPNIYVWINDILDRLENKTPIEKINYGVLDVMRYVKKIASDGHYYSLVTAQGGIPPRTLSRIVNLDSNGDLLSKIIKIIISSLKKSFDIVIMDTDNNFHDITSTILSSADNIIYVLNPTISDIENLKVFKDEVENEQDRNIDLMKVGLVINKLTKQVTFKNDILEVLSLVKYKAINYSTTKEEERNFPLVADIPFDFEVINSCNGYLFSTNNGFKETKNGILKVCEYCVPIFKVKHTTQGLAELNKLRNKMLKKKAKKEHARKEKDAENSANDKENTQVDNTKNSIEQKETNKPKVFISDELKQYLASDLSKITVDDFVKKLNEFDEVPKLKSGFPKINKKPPRMSKKTFKGYVKLLAKELKKANIKK